MKSEPNKENLLTVVADSTQKKFTLMVIIISLLVFTTIFILTRVAVPYMYLQVNGIKNCPSEMKNFIEFCHSYDVSSTQEWHSFALNLNKTNSLLILGGNFLKTSDFKEENTTVLSMDIPISYSAKMISFDQMPTMSFETEIENKETSAPLNTVEIESKMLISCNQDQQKCQSNLLLMYPAIESRNVRFSVKFDMETPIKNLFQQFRFFMYTSNPEYTNYLIALRYTLLAISIIGLISYGIFFAGLQKKNRTFEHKYIFFLSISLIFFNDPLYAVNVFYGSIPLYIFSTLQMSLFVIFLIYFWIVMMPRINFEKNEANTSFMTCTTTLFSVCCFLIICFVLSIQNVYCYFNPSFQFEIQ